MGSVVYAPYDVCGLACRYVRRGKWHCGDPDRRKDLINWTFRG